MIILLIKSEVVFVRLSAVISNKWVAVSEATFPEWHVKLASKLDDIVELGESVIV